MKTKSSRQKKSNAAQSKKRTARNKRTVGRMAARRGKTTRKASFKPEGIQPSTVASESSPEFTGAEGGGAVGVIEVFEITVSNPENEVTNTEFEIVAEEPSEDVV